MKGSKRMEKQGVCEYGEVENVNTENWFNLPLSSNFLTDHYFQYITQTMGESVYIVINIIYTKSNNSLAKLLPNILWSFIIDLKGKEKNSLEISR